MDLETITPLPELKKILAKEQDVKIFVNSVVDKDGKTDNQSVKIFGKVVWMRIDEDCVRQDLKEDYDIESPKLTILLETIERFPETTLIKGIVANMVYIH